MDKINGFIETEVYSLYQFLNFYESNDLKNYNEGEATNRIPLLIEMRAIMDSFSHHEKSTREITLIDIDSLNNEINYTRKVSEFMGFLYHLRNSIAHANIVKEGDKAKITDYDNNRTNPQSTAKGVIKYEIIQKMVDIINKEKHTV